MKNSVKVIIFVGLLLLVGALTVFGLSKIKVDDFHKASVIFIMDSSASNQNKLPEQIKTLKQLCSLLDPEDQIKILRVSEDSYIIYEGSPQSTTEIRKATEAFTKLNEKEYGTAYGLSLNKAFNHSLNMYKEGYQPAIVVMGDLENEGAVEKQINWNTLPDDVAQLKEQTGTLAMMFLYAAPDKLDKVKETLSPVLGETKLIVSNEATVQKDLRKFLNAIGR